MIQKQIIIFWMLLINILLATTIQVDGIKFVKKENKISNSVTLNSTQHVWHKFDKNKSIQNFTISEQLSNPSKEFFPFERIPSESFIENEFLSRIECSDIDNDGLDEIFLFGSHTEIFIYHNDNGNFNTAPQIISSFNGEQYYYSDIILNDFDKDGKIEMVASGSHMTTSHDYDCKGIYLFYFENNDGQFVEPTIIFKDTSTIKSHSTLNLESRDINKDGYTDIVLHTCFSELFNYPILIFYNKNGYFNEEPSNVLYHPQYDAEGLDIVDVNNDNMLDIIISIDTHFHFLEPVLGYISSQDTLPNESNWKGEEETGGSLIKEIDLENDGFEEFWLMKNVSGTGMWNYTSEFYTNERSNLSGTPIFSINTNLIGSFKINEDDFCDVYSPNEMFANKNGSIDSVRKWANNNFLKGSHEKINRQTNASFGKIFNTSDFDFVSIQADYDKDTTGVNIFRQYKNDEVPPPTPDIDSIFWDEYEAKIFLKWEIPQSDDIQGFAIYYTIDPHDSLMQGMGLSNGQAPIIVGIQDTLSLFGALLDTTYYIGIAAIDKGGWRSGLSQIVSIKPQAFPPSPPADFKLTDKKDGVVWAEWTENTEPDLDHYRIYYKNAQDSIFYVELGKENVFHLTDLPCNENLQFWVTAIDNSNAESDPSDTLEIIPQESNFHFEDITKSCGLHLDGWYHINACDINNDGLFDLIFYGEIEGNNTSKPIQLYINKSTTNNISFEEKKDLLPYIPGSKVSPVFLDIDGDGDKDLFYSVFNQSIKFYKNRLSDFNELAFEEQETDSILIPLDSTFYGNRGMSFADLDLDGDLDMVLASKKGLRIFKGLQVEENKIRFLEVNPPLEDDSLGIFPYLLDFDNDGDIDIVYERYKGETDIFVNKYDNGEIFVFEKKSTGFQYQDWLGYLEGHGGLIWNDVNKDGFLDTFLPVLTNDHSTYSYHGLYINNSTTNNPDFENIAEEANVLGEPYGWDGYGFRAARSAVFRDFDNDGQGDIYIGNSMGCNWIESNFYRNVSLNSKHIYFINVVNQKGGLARDNHKTYSMAFDAENDGDLDLILGKFDEGFIHDNETFYFYKNELDEVNNHYLKINLIGTDYNIHAIGSKVEIFKQGFIGDYNNLLGTYYIKTGEGWVSYEPYTIHAGLGENDFVDLKIYFPYGNTKDTLNIPTDQLITIKDPHTFTQKESMIKAINPQVSSKIDYKHFSCRINFSKPIEPSSLNDRSLYVYNETLGWQKGNFNLDGNDSVIVFSPTKNIYPGEMIYFNITDNLKIKNSTSSFPSYQFHYLVKPMRDQNKFSLESSCNVNTEVDWMPEQPDMCLADFNNDGLVDIAVVRYWKKNRFIVLLNKGNAEFLINQQMTFGYGLISIVAHDFDFDGDIDLAVGGDYIYLLINDGNGNFSIKSKFEKGGHIAAYDVDIDGDIDIISDKGYIYLNNGSGTFTGKNVLNCEYPQNEIKIADFNNDGKIDIATAFGNLYLNEGNLKFTRMELPESKKYLIIGDWNNDRYFDIAMYDFYNNNKITFLFNNKYGVFKKEFVLELEKNIGDLATGDFDADGDQDIAVSYWHDKSGDKGITMYKNFNNGHFKKDTFLVVNQYSKIMAFDIDRDGDMDLIGAGHDNYVDIIKKVKINKYGPEISEINLISSLEDDTLDYAISNFYEIVEDQDDPDSVLIYNLYASPNINVQKKDNNFLLIPKKNWFGQDSLLLVVSDGFLSDSGYLPVRIKPVNDQPQFFDLPEIIRFDCDTNYVFPLYKYVKDIETPDSLLAYQLSISNDSISFSFDSLTGNVKLFTAFHQNLQGTFFIKVIDDSGAYCEDSVKIRINVPTGIENIYKGIPDHYVLFQNYPNPFNNTTSIYFGLPENEKVRIDLFNSLGQHVLTLANRKFTPGYHKLIWDARNFSSGMYYIFMKSKKFKKVIKVMLIK